MQPILRLLAVVIYPFLVLSMLLLIGILLSFDADFTVTNRTGEDLVVTPVGAVGSEGHRSLLPLRVTWGFLSWPALKVRGFGLEDGAATTFTYDMDDINFSEVLIQDASGALHQVTTDPQPTKNQYHGPLMTDIVIRNLGGLEPATPDVIAAAKVNWLRRQTFVICSLIVAPWFGYGIVTFLLARTRRKAVARTPNPATASG